MQVIEVQCVVKPDMMPVYQSAGSSGADLLADIDEVLVLKPGERALVPTGIRLAVPSGFEAQVRPRSGLSWRYGVSVLNTPGTIDSDYRGEIKIVLANFGSKVFSIKRGDRIAQIVFAPVVRGEFVVRGSIESSDRGEGGFGSTGV